MWFFPYDKFSIISNLQPEEALDRLKSAIYIADFNFYGKDYDVYATKYFTGYVTNKGFKMQLNVKPTKNFLPDIHGNMVANGNGILVNIKITAIPACTIMLFLILFLCFAGVEMNISAKKFNAINLFPFAMAIMAYCVTWLPFIGASKRAKNILLNIFEGELEK